MVALWSTFIVTEKGREAFSLAVCSLGFLHMLLSPATFFLSPTFLAFRACSRVFPYSYFRPLLFPHQMDNEGHHLERRLVGGTVFQGHPERGHEQQRSFLWLGPTPSDVSV